MMNKIYNLNNYVSKKLIIKQKSNQIYNIIKINSKVVEQEETTSEYCN